MRLPGAIDSMLQYDSRGCCVRRVLWRTSPLCSAAIPCGWSGTLMWKGVSPVPVQMWKG